MRISLFLVVCVLASAVPQATAVSVGDGLWRTFNLALTGHAPTLPLTVEEAKQQQWQSMSNTCDPNRGYRYALKSSTPQKNTPLTMYFTAGGQVAGLAVDIYGAGSAPQNLVNMGFWIPVATNQWTMSVSFRNGTILCNGQTDDEILGDQLVINQGKLNLHVPLTLQNAADNRWTAGSCMTTMGQHWFYDLSTAPQMSWQSENLLPIVPMYYGASNTTATLNAFFFTTPVAQPGSNQILHAPGDWEMPALTPPNMCQNFCDESCQWPGVTSWSTMHIYVNSQWPDITCPGGSGLLDRSCLPL